MEIPPWMNGVAFTVAQGREAGLTPARLRRRELQRPFRGMRVVGRNGRIDGGLIDRCGDLRVVLPRAAVFSHATAARLWGMPLAAHLSDDLHVLIPRGVPVRRPGVLGWTRDSELGVAQLRHGLPVTTPADTWALLATMSARRGGGLSREWLVAVGDFLLSGRRVRYGREPALATRAELAAAVRRHGSRRGAVALRWALERLRDPVDSPPETFLRLGLVEAGLPEPAVQPSIPTRAGLRHPDAGYLDERVLLEYLGDVHRVDPDTWRRDLTRVQLFEDAGYRTILVGADDLTPDGLPALARRVHRALRAR